MINIITNIMTGIESRLKVALPNYTKLPYQIDISKNKFKPDMRGYSIAPSSAGETDSVIGAFTLDQSFEVTLSKQASMHGGKSQIDDSSIQENIISISDDILTAYKDLSVNKTIVDSSILIINGLSIEKYDYSENDKVISISFSFNIKYKINQS